MIDAIEDQDARALFIYDGDCAFCKYWVRYYQALTHNRVRFAPYQLVGRDYPEISADEFHNSVQYVSAGRRIASGAEATFMTLSHAPGQGIWLKAYRHLPGFGRIAERVYHFIAARRGKLYRPTVWLWGKDYTPPRYDLVSWLFLRALGLIYLAAFISFGVQALGLIGSAGILPLPEFLAQARQAFGDGAYWRFPTIFWIDSSDFAIQAVCWSGAALAALLVFNVWPRICLSLLFILYLSLFHAGQTFTQFQWDLFLLETGFIALFLATWPALGTVLGRWLLFRFMFLSGVVKLLSNDPSWRGLTALGYHFETQPLPTPLAWYAHQFPEDVLVAATFAMLVIELVLAFFIFLPRRPRFIAAGGFILLQTSILLTGNYNWFNLLTLALCIFLFDDQAMAKLWRWRIKPLPAVGRAAARTAVTLAIPLFALGALQTYATFDRESMPAWAVTISRAIEPLMIVNPYGLFAVMTTERPEITIEGSRDGSDWREYVFKFKPGPLARPPLWNIPHQPRLDWQMWFAALDSVAGQLWFERFLQRLLEASPEVLGLLKSDPFAGKRPKYVQALIYDYRFATSKERSATGQWWRHRPIGYYYPPISLRLTSQRTQPATPGMPGLIMPSR